MVSQSPFDNKIARDIPHSSDKYQRFYEPRALELVEQSNVLSRVFATARVIPVSH